MRHWKRIPPRILKLIFSSDQAKPASLKLETYSLGNFGKMPTRGFSLMFTPRSKHPNKKVSHEALKTKIFGPGVEIPQRILKIIFSPDPGKPASLKLETYSLGFFFFEKSQNEFTPGTKGTEKESVKRGTENGYFRLLCWNTTTYLRANFLSRSS